MSPICVPPEDEAKLYNMSGFQTDLKKTVHYVMDMDVAELVMLAQE